MENTFNEKKSNEKKSFFSFLKDEIIECIKTKWIGCFVGLAAWLLTFIQIFTYSGINAELFHGGVIAVSVIALILYAVLSLFRKTSVLAPVVLMVCGLLCLAFFASAEGFTDYFSTTFFSGFSFGTFFSLSVSVWFSMLSFILSFILASVAMYLPQNKKKKETLTVESSADGIAEGENND